jgi:hypothetical protein
LECHTLAPFVHYLPQRYRRPLLRNCTLWGLLARPTPAQVDEFLASTRLLSFEEMQLLFPDCTILVERFAGLAKSYIAFRPIGKMGEPNLTAASREAACFADKRRGREFADLQIRRANLQA